MQKVMFILETMYSIDTDQMETDVSTEILRKLENRNVSQRRLMVVVSCSV